MADSDIRGTLIRACVRRGVFHVAVIVLVLVASQLGRMDASHLYLSIHLERPTAVPTRPPHAVVSAPTSARGAERKQAVASAISPRAMPIVRLQGLFWSPVPHTIIPERPRRSVITYTVQPGDNVFIIADRFGLKNETIIWANEELETDPDMLYVGQVLNILPIDGIYYTVREGDTLDKIAKRYKVSVEAILNCEYNGLEPGASEIKPGQKLIVPGGVKPFKPRYIRYYTGPYPKDAPRGSGNFVWPVGGHISQGDWKLHRAIDISGRHGDIVVAADDGVVVYAAWERSGYGNLVIIDHGNGFTTYYAHLYGFYVDVGQAVRRGQPIGARGNTGRSTGPHLHFEIRYNGVQRNPLGFLPRE